MTMLLLLFLLFSGSPAGPQNAPAAQKTKPEPPKWEMTTPKPYPMPPGEEDNPFFSPQIKNYDLRVPEDPRKPLEFSCTVGALGNGGLFLAAHVAKFNGGPISESGFILVGIGLTNVTHTTSHGGGVVMGEEVEFHGRLLFERYCAGHAARLPLDVRKRFHGEFGISSAPTI